uniref:Uncharacterized protein AlNc14C7G951 n=1 Tax=Albugo laibachii Nc14 TaxID=890382 RepID=F0W1I3_9STRA|nr:conserved hypothetical protein [Albugo laibachii Nc14]|eukprot:CCA14912.1 conserved hypothetical protein [Albugo laibachii Nc14]
MQEIEQVRLVELTSEEAKVQCKIDDYQEWGHPFWTQEEYQRKEKIQRSTRFASDNSIFLGLLANESEENDSKLEIICHCEVHRFDCMLKARQSEQLRWGYSYHIASVFTLPAYRRRGYAAFFMQEVAEFLRTRPKAIASALFSDIGPNYYTKLGWKVFPSDSAVIDLVSSDNTVEFSIDEAKSLFMDQKLDALLREDAERIKQQLLDDETLSNMDVLATIPTFDSIEWQFCIGRYYAESRVLDPRPMECGYRINADAFIVWALNFKESTLFVLRTRMDCACEQVLQLLHAAIVQANRYKLRYIKIWQPSSILFSSSVQKYLVITKVVRTESLSSLIFFPEMEDTTLLWLLNEKFSWV